MTASVGAFKVTEGREWKKKAQMSSKACCNLRSMKQEMWYNEIRIAGPLFLSLSFLSFCHAPLPNTQIDSRDSRVPHKKEPSQRLED